MERRVRPPTGLYGKMQARIIIRSERIRNSILLSHLVYPDAPKMSSPKRKEMQEIGDFDPSDWAN